MLDVLRLPLAEQRPEERVAMQNSNATSDDELHPLREVPHWTWPDEQ